MDNANKLLLASDKDRKEIQHKLKIFAEKYFKEHIEKSIDEVHVLICEDIIIGRGKGFLTGPEKSIVKNTKDGAQKVNETRLLLADDFSDSVKNIVYELIGVPVINNYIEVDSINDFTMVVVILDRKVT